jgi:hypothetical protein
LRDVHALLQQYAVSFEEWALNPAKNTISLFVQPRMLPQTQTSGRAQVLEESRRSGLIKPNFGNQVFSLSKLLEPRWWRWLICGVGER